MKLPWDKDPQVGGHPPTILTMKSCILPRAIKLDLQRCVLAGV